jgi:hypothetical protein
VQRVDERVSSGYLERPAPRPFPLDALADLLIDHVLRPGLRGALDPVVVAALISLAALTLTHAPWLLSAGALAILAARIWPGAARGVRRVADEVALLRGGIVMRAHVLRLTPHRDALGDIDGARLDCAIAVAPRRTYIGSIWLTDGAEATAVAAEGRLLVICLPTAPGTWRVIAPLRSEVRYERSDPLPPLPED